MEHDYTILYDTIKNMVEVESMPTMLEKWIADAVAKERTRFEKWSADTEAKTGRNVLLAILREKIGRVSPEMEQRILAMTDPIALQSWAVQASICQSLENLPRHCDNMSSALGQRVRTAN